MAGFQLHNQPKLAMMKHQVTQPCAGHVSGISIWLGIGDQPLAFLYLAVQTCTRGLHFSKPNHSLAKGIFRRDRRTSHFWVPESAPLLQKADVPIWQRLIFGLCLTSSVNTPQRMLPKPALSRRHTPYESVQSSSVLSHFSLLTNNYHFTILFTLSYRISPNQ